MGISKMRPFPTDLWTDEDLIALPVPVKWTAAGLRMHADDEGRESVTDWMLRPSIWPGRNEVDADVLVEHLLVLSYAGVIGIYTIGDRTYYQLRVWPSVSHPQRSKHPPPPPELFQNGSGWSPADFSAGERESGESAGERPDQRPSGLPPSPFCRDHQPAGSGGTPCVLCQDARLAYQVWVKEQREEYRL